MSTQIKHYEDKLHFEIDSADLFNAIRDGENVIIIDARSTEGYDNEHIPGAVSLPHRAMNVESTTHLDPSALLVTYCDGIGCNASTKGALNLAKLGFQVKELQGGLDWWKRDGYETVGVTGEKRTVEVSCYC
ncbi:MAG: rhodanese-like domain-containing protein [Chitinophagaceae bacterium]